MNFNHFKLSGDILKGIKFLGYEKPTEVQSLTIPQVLSGLDLIVQAQTGTGKTSAFGIPIVEMVKRENRFTQALILVPTRELAWQVGEELRALSRFKGLRVLVVYGGRSISRQIDFLKNKGAQIVVGTPGRVKDLLGRDALSLLQTKMLVLDEGDRMLDMGFIEDVKVIAESIPTDRQTLFFSATFNGKILRVAKSFLKAGYEVIRIKADEPTLETITQKIYKTKEKERLAKLILLLRTQPKVKTIVFTSTKREVEFLTEGLKQVGFSVEGLHGDFSQKKREATLRSFRNGELNILVATDVASRGLDIKGVELVINYRLPRDTDSYIHRIGRTGRAGRLGTAISFASDNEEKYLKSILERVKESIEVQKEDVL